MGRRSPRRFARLTTRSIRSALAIGKTIVAGSLFCALNWLRGPRFGAVRGARRSAGDARSGARGRRAPRRSTSTWPRSAARRAHPRGRRRGSGGPAPSVSGGGVGRGGGRTLAEHTAFQEVEGREGAYSFPQRAQTSSSGVEALEREELPEERRAHQRRGSAASVRSAPTSMRYSAALASRSCATWSVASSIETAWVRQP